MSHIVKLGALEIAKDMIDNSPEEEKGSSRLWCAGFFAGLHEVDSITLDDLDSLTNFIREIK